MRIQSLLHGATCAYRVPGRWRLPQRHGLCGQFLRDRIQAGSARMSQRQEVTGLLPPGDAPFAISI